MSEKIWRICLCGGFNGGGDFGGFFDRLLVLFLFGVGFGALRGGLEVVRHAGVEATADLLLIYVVVVDNHDVVADHESDNFGILSS